MLGLDYLYLANRKLAAAVPEPEAARLVDAMRSTHTAGKRW
jgi:hypothetical protein